MDTILDKLREYRKILEKSIQAKEYSNVLKNLDILLNEFSESCNNTEQYSDNDYLKIQENLIQTQEKFYALFRSSRDAIVLVSDEGFIDCNNAALELYGYEDKEEFLNLHPADLSPEFQPDGRKSLELSNDYIRKAYKKKVPIFEWIHKKKSGEEFPCEVLLSTINLGYRLAVHAVIRDISERKESELKLKRSEEKFRKLTELSPSAISIQRGNRYYYVNSAWTEITGYNQSDIKSIGPFDIIHPDMIDYVKAISKEKLKNEGDKFRYDLKIITRDKRIKWLDISITTIEYNDQNASFAISNDITDIREIQHALKENEQKYRGLIENFRQEYIFYRHKEKGAFEYVSPSVKDILGYEPSDFMSHYLKYFTKNPMNDVAIAKTELAMQGIQQLPYELEIYDVQKNKHVLEISEAPVVDSEGNVLAVEGIAHDITSKKKAEKIINDQLEEIQISNEEIKSMNEELHAVNDDLERRIEEINKLNQDLRLSEQKLKETNAQKDKFFSLLAHDLRSPIGNFLQITELLKLQHQSLSPEQAGDFFNNLYGLADRTFKLLENLLIWSRSQLGHLEIQSTRFKLKTLLNDVVYLLEENLKAKNITFENDIPETLEVYADKNIVQTVCRNLIGNAIKFTYESGKIAVRCSGNESEESEKYVISVEDNGIGIAADKIDRIFNINEDYTTLGTKNEKGTGLGLILCKELIEKTGEKIWVESEYGKGTTFYFTLKR